MNAGKADKERFLMFGRVLQPLHYYKIPGAQTHPAGKLHTNYIDTPHLLSIIYIDQNFKSACA